MIYENDLSAFVRVLNHCNASIEVKIIREKDGRIGTLLKFKKGGHFWRPNKAWFYLRFAHF